MSANDATQKQRTPAPRAHQYADLVEDSYRGPVHVDRLDNAWAAMEEGVRASLLARIPADVTGTEETHRWRVAYIRERYARGAAY